METIAFIGCGAMGAPIAERLIDAGYAVRLFDPRAEAMAPLVQARRVAAIMIFLTARADAAAQTRCMALGALGCIAKPFNPLQLGDQIGALLASRPVVYEGPAA